VERPDGNRCAVCANPGLQPHFRVAGEAGDAGLIPTTDRFGTALADIVRCPTCGHMQLERFPSEEVLAEAYGEASSQDYVEEEAGQRATARVALDRIERFTARGRIADLGCWVGFLLAEARERGWEPVGVEPSEFASSYARDRLGLDVRTADLFEAGLATGNFDAVVMGDVIEHLVDPGAALDRIAELLRPGGVVHLTLPDSGSRVARAMGPRWWSVIPTHLQYFTRGSLERLLRAHGYEPLFVATAPKAFTLDYYLGRIGGYAPAVANVLRGGARVTGVSEHMLVPDFRDRMAFVARGPASR
jgi:SAM-dependent methyltransferase